MNTLSFRHFPARPASRSAPMCSGKPILAGNRLRASLFGVSMLAIGAGLAAASLAIASPAADAAGRTDVLSRQVGISPWGKDDELGRLNLMTDASRAAVLSRINGGDAYDLSVEYFVGMPSWHGIGDPRYQFWLTHTPRGTVVDDPLQVGDSQNALVSYTGDAVSMYTHMGTHIDALNHFGLHGKIWNGFAADRYLGDKGWQKTGAETIPPIIARGVLIDLPTALGMNQLPAHFRVMRSHIEQALKLQRVSLQQGDIVLLRTGRMQDYENAEQFM